MNISQEALPSPLLEIKQQILEDSLTALKAYSSEMVSNPEVSIVIVGTPPSNGFSPEPNTFENNDLSSNRPDVSVTISNIAKELSNLHRQELTESSVLVKNKPPHKEVVE